MRVRHVHVNARRYLVAHIAEALWLRLVLLRPTGARLTVTLVAVVDHAYQTLSWLPQFEPDRHQSI